MANLRGGTHEKQVVNALHRMERLGESSRFDDDKNAHSVAVLEDRKAILKDFAEYAKNTLDSSDKLNTLMTNENINNFLNERLEGLKASSAETYARGLSATIESLSNNNITVNFDKEIINNFVNEVKAADTSTIELNRSITDLNGLYKELGEKHEMSQVLAQVQAELGLRVSEAVDLVKNINDYALRDSNQVLGLDGKGGKEYEIKEISRELIARIDNIDKQISKETYQRDLRELGEKSHNLRISFAKNEYDKKINNEGLSHKEALSAVSVELNHKREDITTYYLVRA